MCFAGLLTMQAGVALGSAFTVTPVRILLGPGANSALLTVRNDSTEPLRFQVSLKAWNQSPAGAMELSDTSDLVFFPTLMDLKAGEEKKVRIGSAFKGSVMTERAYRIFFEELPPAHVATPQPGAQIRMLTKMGVPIFIQPPAVATKGEIANTVFNGRRLSFDIRNSGNSFFTTTGPALTGLSKTAAETFKLQNDGWYILAGGSRHYDIELPADVCATTDQIRIAAQTSIGGDKGSVLTTTVPVSAGDCRPAPSSH